MKFIVLALLGVVSALSIEKHSYIQDNFVELENIKHDKKSGLKFWKKLDRDHDGKLTKKEAHTAIKKSHFSKDEKRLLHVTIELVWEKADKDKSGDLSKEEFLESWVNDKVTPESVINGCKAKGSDELTKDQATKCMAKNLAGADEKWRNYGTKWMDKLFDKLDTDHDGKLSKKEIEDGMKKLEEESKIRDAKKAKKKAIKKEAKKGKK